MTNQFLEGLRYVVTFDREVYSIAFRTLFISGSAIIISALIGVPLGGLLGLSKTRFKGAIALGLNTLMGFPTVVVGLLVYITFTKNGLFGFMNLLYTPVVMVVAQVILAVPIIAALTFAVISHIDKELVELAVTSGANRLQTLFALARETRAQLVGALMAGFGRIVTEIGAALIVGGNIKGETRVLSTAVALETGKGNFSVALSLGFILLIVALVVNFLALKFKGR